MIRRPPRSTQSRSSAASDVYKRQALDHLGRGLGDDLEMDLLQGLRPLELRPVAAGRRWPELAGRPKLCLLYTSPSPRDRTRHRMPSSA